jgi:hypothetical protein
MFTPIFFINAHIVFDILVQYLIDPFSFGLKFVDEML